MARNGRQLLAFAGSYASVDDAKADYEALNQLHRERVIGKFQGGVFEKDCDGNVRVLDTVATSRATGARVGLAEGALVGLLFPPALPLTALIGTGLGAAVGNLAKGWTRDQITELGKVLGRCEAGVVLVAEAAPGTPAEALLPHAEHTERKMVAQNVDEVLDSLEPNDD